MTIPVHSDQEFEQLEHHRSREKGVRRGNGRNYVPNHKPGLLGSHRLNPVVECPQIGDVCEELYVAFVVFLEAARFGSKDSLEAGDYPDEGS